MPAGAQRKLAAIMLTDMVGYSALTQRNEKLALQLLEEQKELLRAAFLRYGGKEVKTIGDAFLVEFASAVEAVRSSIEIQETLAKRNLATPPERHIQVRIGLHVGDIVYQDDDVFGDGVNIASRIEPLAEPGGICLSEDVARHIQNKVDFPVQKLSRPDLKNIQTPVDVYRIALPWETGAGRGRAVAPPAPAAEPRPRMSAAKEKLLEAFVYVSVAAALAHYLSVHLGVAFWTLFVAIGGVLLTVELSIWLIPLRGKLQALLLLAIVLPSWGYLVYVLNAMVSDVKVSTVAGTGRVGSEDGPAIASSFYMPYDVDVVNDVLYVAEYWGMRVRRIDENRQVTTLALVNSPSQGQSDVFSVEWRSNPPSDELPPLGFVTSLAATELGKRIYIADSKYNRIWLLQQAREGLQLAPYAKDVELDTPEDVVVDGVGNVLYVLEAGNQTIRRFDLKTSTSSCYAGPFGVCRRYLPLQDASGLAFLNGTLYIVDGGTHTIWFLPEAGEPTSVGSGEAGYKDGDFKQAKFHYPSDVAVMPSTGDLYVADWGNRLIRKIGMKQQIVETVAGRPFSAGSADGPGRFASFRGACGIDIEGPNLFIADFEDQRIRKVSLR